MYGTSAGSGTTHLCIALSNYLCGKFRRNTAYLEMNGSRQIHTLSGKKNSKAPFVHQQITYFPEMTVARSREVQAENYKYCVLDFGSYNPHTVQEFIHCDIRLVVGSINPWKIAQYREVIQKLDATTLKKEVIVYIYHYTENPGNLKQLSREFCGSFVAMPFLPNPFQITSESFAFFEKILGGK